MIKAKVITPHVPFKAGVFRQQIHAEGIKVMAEMTKDFNKTVRTWEHNVDFDGVVNDKPSEVNVSVTTDDLIYKFVDQGTKPHIIRPKRAKGILSFKSKYKAKTKPHVISSHAGGASGKMIFAKQVHHPGTDARYFARDIQAKWQPKFKIRITKAIARAAKESGHRAT